MHQSGSHGVIAAAGHHWVTFREPRLLPVGMVKVQAASQEPRECAPRRAARREPGHRD